MSIELSLDEKSVKQLLENIKKIKKQVRTNLVKDLLIGCCEAIKRRSIEKLEILSIGSNVKNEIINHWHISDVVRNTITLYNDSDKSVYVEFGVGKVGRENPHPESVSQNYQYDVDGKKLEDRSWIFNVSSDDDIDIQAEFIDNRTTNTVRTKGSEATMFVYNAMRDFVDEKEVYKIWDDVKKKYWGK